MNDLHIVTDSAVDMPGNWQEEYAIDILPVNMNLLGKSYLPGVDLDDRQFYELMKNKLAFPKTSLPSPQQVIEFYKKIAKRGDSILSIHVASKMSGTFNAVQLAAREIMDQYSIYPFDSGNGSAGLAFMCREARMMERSGKSIQNIIQRLDEIRKKIVIVLTLDTMEYARRSGRISAIQERISTILKIKPIIELKDGMLQVAGKIRTRKKSIETVIEQAKKKIGNQKVNMAIVHAQDYSAATELIKIARDRFTIQEMITTDLSISVTANLGPGTVGIIAYPVKDENG
jgi:DegV family protein with EDD domain